MKTRLLVATLLAMLFLGCAPSQAQTYSGMLGPLTVKLHLSASACSIDTPARHAVGIRCTNVRQIGSAIAFDVLALGSSWRGSTASDGSLVGFWTQNGRSMRLNFKPTRKGGAR